MLIRSEYPATQLFEVFQSKRSNNSMGQFELGLKYIGIKKDISKLGYAGTGRKYGVSGNTIRKWLKSYENLHK
jgi:hypothetical protein